MVRNSHVSDLRFKMYVVRRWLELIGFVIRGMLDEAVRKQLEMHVK
jgi:hypothetical protein